MTLPLELESTLRALSPPPREAGVLAVAVASLPGDRAFLGIDADAMPCLLLEGMPLAGVPPLQHLQVFPDLECKVHLQGTSLQRTCTLVRCTHPDETLQSLFFETAYRLVADQDSLSVSESLSLLVEMLALASATRVRSVQGVWAELFLLCNSQDLSRSVQAWHSLPSDPFDFCEGRWRLEIKSTRSSIRKHRLSLEQTRPSMRLDCILISIGTRPTDDGVSVSELVSETSSRFGSDLSSRARFDSIVTACTQGLGDELNELRFDLDHAKQTLAMFDMKDVPSVERAKSNAVTRVEFDADLSNTEAIARDQIDSDSLAAAFAHLID